MEKKPYLVDVPVRVNVWIRPEAQRKQFEILKEARPSMMFLISDGGRNEAEWDAIRQNRALFENEIDGNCTVYKIFEEKNNGLYTMSRKAADLVWSVTDRCIFLEDDHIVSVSYFKFAAELLEKYKDDTRIICICCMNQAEVWEDTTSDYFFSERGPIGAQAMWKRSYMNRDFNLEYGKDPYVMKLLNHKLKKDKAFAKTVNGYALDPMYGKHIPGGEFFSRLAVYSQNQLYIIPKYNMMSNIGCTENSEHAAEYKLLPRGIRRIFNMKIYEYEFPLKHPKYVIADEEYMKFEDKVLCRNRPIQKFFRKIEVLFLFIRHRGISGLFKKIKKKLLRKKTGET